MGRVSRIIRAVRTEGMPCLTEAIQDRRCHREQPAPVRPRDRVSVGRGAARFGKEASLAKASAASSPATGSATAPRSVMDLVRKSVEDMLGSISGEKPIPQTKSLLPATPVGLVGTIYFVGDITWSLNLIFPQFTAKSLVKKFSGMEIGYDSPEMDDVVGELINVVGGAVGAHFNDNAINVQMSLPMVVRCPDLNSAMPVELNLTVVCYFSPEGNLWLRTRVADSCTNAIRMPGA